MNSRDVARQLWRKSRRSNGQAECVEMADLTTQVGVRDSKDPDGPSIALSRELWTGLSQQIKAGHYDL